MESAPLRLLDLNRNHIRSEGAAALGLALQRSDSMEVVHAQNNGVQEKGALALAVALKSSESMLTVDLNGNSFPYVRLKIDAMLQGCDRPVQLLYE